MSPLKIFVCALLSIFICSGNAIAAEKKPLTKTDAVTILTHMGWESAQVGAVVEVDGSAESRVFGMGLHSSEIRRIDVIFRYDIEIGWFYHEFDGRSGEDQRLWPTTKLRIWSLSGYKEITPKWSMPDSVAAEKVLGTWREEVKETRLTYNKDGTWIQTAAFNPTPIAKGTWSIKNGVIISVGSTSVQDDGVKVTKPSEETGPIQWQIIFLGQGHLHLRSPGQDLKFKQIAK